MTAIICSGLPHNQLLSPQTPYLGICGSNGAGVVNLPYEHATFMRRMTAMRCDDGADKERRLAVLRDIGMDMAKIPGSETHMPASLKRPIMGSILPPKPRD